MTPETTLQINIVEALSIYAARYKFIFFSVPNEGAFKAFGLDKINKAIFYALLTLLKKMGLLPGVSDLIILHRGRAYCVEVKTQTGKQSEAQRLFQARCDETGIPYSVVRSVEEAIEKLKEWRIIE